MKKYLFFIMLSLSITECGQTETDYFKSGNAKFDLQDYPGAIADYSKAIKLSPDDAGLYINRGLAKDNLQDHRGA